MDAADYTTAPEVNFFRVNEGTLQRVFRERTGYIKVLHVRDKEKRKLIHQYLERQYLKLGQVSMYCDYFSGDEICTLARCQGEENCSNRSVKLYPEQEGCDSRLEGRCD